MNDKIALAMICLGTGKEPDNLRRALQSAAPYVDGIYITLTGPRDELKAAEKICKEFKAHVSYDRALWTADQTTVDWLKDFFGYESHMKVGDRIFLFDQARNFNFGTVPQDYGWIFWMDTDDVLRNGQMLRTVIDSANRNTIEAVYLNYYYQVELEPGHEGTPPQDIPIRHTIIRHLRERLVANNGKYKWIAPIHETLIEQVPTNKTDNYDCDVLHLATMEDRVSSLTRNLKNLELAIKRSDGKDPRHIYYLAKAFYDINSPEYDDKAIPLITSYLDGEHKSGWPQERAQACTYLADIFRRKGEHNNAVKAGMNALIESPEDPAIFLNIAYSYCAKQDWERALFWVKLASTIPEAKTTLVQNPFALQGQSLEILYNCCLNLGKIDEAWAAGQQMLELMPDHPSVQQAYQFIVGLREQRDVTKTIVRLAEYLKASGESNKVPALLQSVPRIAEDTPFVIDLQNQHNPPVVHGEKSVVIFCGPGFTSWSPKRLQDPREAFVGGSEEAVICMARELAKLGWQVTVYGDPGDETGEYDGVTYLPYYKFNKNDEFNVLIAWRQLGFVDNNIKAKKFYVWNHDIQNPLEWTEERVNKITKAMFLSKWHRDNVPNLPEDKVFLTSNGL